LQQSRADKKVKCINVYMKKRRKSGSDEKVSPPYKRKCPFVNEPFDYCYCTSTDSVNVNNVILYCGGNFEDCTIYQDKTNGRNSY
jgi:hypothetical protein